MRVPHRPVVRLAAPRPPLDQRLIDVALCLSRQSIRPAPTHRR